MKIRDIAEIQDLTIPELMEEVDRLFWVVNEPLAMDSDSFKARPPRDGDVIAIKPGTPVIFEDGVWLADGWGIPATYVTLQYPNSIKMLVRSALFAALDEAQEN